MSITAGAIIYKAFLPTLKMALCILAGYVITKSGMLPPASSKGIALITMNVGLPCLIFSSMVSAFTSQNVSAFGPLVLVAVMYQTLGLILTWIVREIVYVPQDFRWGILVMGLISNWGNLPTAVVQTVAKEAPFNPTTDVDLGVAYIAIFVLVMNTTFFALGVHKICGWDFTESQVVPDPLPFRLRWHRRLHKMEAYSRLVLERLPHRMPRPKESSRACHLTAPTVAQNPEGFASARDGSATTRCPKPNASPELLFEAQSVPVSLGDRSLTELAPPPSSGRQGELWKTFIVILRKVPLQTWSVILGLIFSLVQPLKALFTPVPSWTGNKIQNAPDGNPPLHVILETAEYLGAVTVPLALIQLGASFGRLKSPSRWRDLPLAAIVSMTTIKMIIIPVFSVFVVQALQSRTTLFPPSQKIRTFVALLLSGTPAAANQLVITQLYNPAGTAHTLASFLLLQYALMFILSTALAAVALYIVE